MKLVPALLRFVLALAALTLGLVTAAAAVVLHDLTWTLVLAGVATGSTLWALPAGVRGRVPYALGWMVVLALAVTPTSAGGYLVGSTTTGYAVLGLGLIALSASIATFPLKRRRRLAGHDQRPGDPNDLAG
ncbi:hypothetical protein Back2_10160 [Nocardioides baekrokdamisoli]|uniref:Uncharacterized protein n=1 Tax=Nocardioides baekrokdamisoli TaxID=1804624 RepID=A0A3G9J192_9ACTN|nr:hypothetical protein [Nocardioides baekrokdamisoli]BBH16729.1 hypothetical protein Back2_10160 [Nocardioides baekrokdamisoli]